jgi:hypothetical protein
MRDIPADLGGYTLMVTECPERKTREVDGRSEAVVDRATNAAVFTVSLFAKLRASDGVRRAKGEEIKVTLETDPGEGFEEGSYVQLVNLRVSPYSFLNDRGQTLSGLSFKAVGLTPVQASRKAA